MDQHCYYYKLLLLLIYTYICIYVYCYNYTYTIERAITIVHWSTQGNVLLDKTVGGSTAARRQGHGTLAGDMWLLYLELSWTWGTPIAGWICWGKIHENSMFLIDSLGVALCQKLPCVYYYISFWNRFRTQENEEIFCEKSIPWRSRGFQNPSPVLYNVLPHT